MTRLEEVEAALREARDVVEWFAGHRRPDALAQLARIDAALALLAQREGEGRPHFIIPPKVGAAFFHAVDRDHAHTDGCGGCQDIKDIYAALANHIPRGAPRPEGEGRRIECASCHKAPTDDPARRPDDVRPGALRLGRTAPAQDPKETAMAYSRQLIKLIASKLDTLADEYAHTRKALEEARIIVQVRYEMLVLIHQHAVRQGIDVPPLPPLPVLYQPGVAKRAKLARAARTTLQEDRHGRA